MYACMYVYTIIGQQNSAGLALVYAEGSRVPAAHLRPVAEVFGMVFVLTGMFINGGGGGG